MIDSEINNEGDTPLVSVITPVFNSEMYLERMIESVIAQSYSNWELILVDDCSTDNSKDIIAQYAASESRIRFFNLDKNQGSGAARNKAMSNSRGTYLAFLDADDIWLPSKLEVQTLYMRKNDLAFTFTSFGYISSSGIVLNSVRHAGLNMIDFDKLVHGTTIGCLTVMLDVEKTGIRKMPDIRVKQDFALWAEILRDGFIAHPINEKLSLYRMTDGSATSKKSKLVLSHYSLLRSTLGLPVISSMYGVFYWSFSGICRALLIKFKK